MKKIITIISSIILTVSCIAQTGTGWVSQRAKVNFRDSTNFIKLPLINKVDTIATKAYARSVGGFGGMVYPGSGIALSTGSAWGTSITNNSANWNTAYSWGNHASAGYAPLASPTFTGTVTIPSPFTLGATSVTSTGIQLNYLNTATGATGTGNMVFSDNPTFITGITTPVITGSGGEVDFGSEDIKTTGDLTVGNIADVEDIAIPGAVVKVTLGVYGEDTDFNFSNAANHTAENIDLGSIVPAKASVMMIHVVCIETCANSGGAVDITFRAGNASAGEQFIASASCDDANEVLQIDNSLTTIPVMNWASATNVWIGGDPDQNWSTMTAGQWAIYVTYAYYGDI